MSDNEAWPEWAPKVIAHDFVDDSGDLLPYDFSGLEKQARYNAIPADIKECLEELKSYNGLAEGDSGWDWPDIFDRLNAGQASVVQLLDYLGAL